VLTDPNSKTPTPGGFSLLDEQNRLAHFPLRFPALAHLWCAHLALHLTELGFHQQYQILARIGKGSTSQVYRVQRLSDGQIFAAKAFLKSYLEGKEERRKSVMNEIALLRAM
jgi:serine/threonine protein kinase